MVLATGVTAATRVLPVLSDTAVTRGDVAAFLSVLVQSGGLNDIIKQRGRELGHIQKIKVKALKFQHSNGKDHIIVKYDIA
jgi:hypothetical protein